MRAQLKKKCGKRYQVDLRCQKTQEKNRCTV